MGLRAPSTGLNTLNLREAHGMGIWLELGIFLVILGFGVWQLIDVKKAIREREQRQQTVALFLVEGATGAANVVENSTSGDVRACLNNAFDASALPFVADGVATPGTLNVAARTITGAVGYTGYVSSDRAGNPVAVQFRDGRAHKAVGVLSMDSLSNSTPTSKWTFRALDGAGEITWGGVIATPPVVSGTGRLPTLANLTDGTWDQQGVISINIPNRTTGNKLALLNDFLVQAKSPALLA
eukprot:gene24599-45392_t